jgi:hypothetical protein
MATKKNREETQRFAILNVLVDYTGTQLTPTVIENIMAGIETEMREGACSWAFNAQEDT